MNTAQIVLLTGVLAVAAYFVINSTSSGTSSACAGNWTDYINPLCILGNSVNNAENEVNTILIIVALVIVAVIGFLAFGPQSAAVAGHAAKFAL